MPTHAAGNVPLPGANGFARSHSMGVPHASTCTSTSSNGSGAVHGGPTGGSKPQLHDWNAELAQLLAALQRPLAPGGPPQVRVEGWGWEAAASPLARKKPAHSPCKQCRVKDGPVPKMAEHKKQSQCRKEHSGHGRASNYAQGGKQPHCYALYNSDMGAI
eukprot:scaffold224777_cov24-Tisochrysis_lutea.AAC.1